MRRRLLLSCLAVLALLLLGLTVPLGVALAASDSRTMYAGRLTEAVRLAGAAQPALRTGRAADLVAELTGYEQRRGVAVAVVDSDGRPVARSPAVPALDEPGIRARIAAALGSGDRTSVGVAWPWDDGPMVVAAPVVDSGRLLGAVVTLSPTGALRDRTLRNWAGLAGLDGSVLLIVAVTGGPLRRRLMRPVRQLDEAVRQLALGRAGHPVVVRSNQPELRQLAASVDAMGSRIAALVQRQQSFVSAASHQLRTPLGTLRLCTDNLRPFLSPDGLEEHEMLVDELDRMAEICNGLLAYARAEASAVDVVDVDVSALAESRVRAWRASAESAQVQLVHRGDDQVVARATVEAVAQSIDALVDNAVKYAGAGADVVVVTRREFGGWVRVDVVDNGPGMPAEELVRVTEPFWRRPADQNRSGTGLGVTIASALVAACGGSLTLMAAHPHGVHASIRLPAADPSRELSREAA